MLTKPGIVILGAGILTAFGTGVLAGLLLAERGSMLG